MDLQLREWANSILCSLSSTPIQMAWGHGTMPISALCATRNPHSADRVDSSSPIRAAPILNRRKTRSSDWFRIDSEEKTPFLHSNRSLDLRVKFVSSTSPMEQETGASISYGLYEEAPMTQPFPTVHLPNRTLRRSTRQATSLSAFPCK